MKTKFRKGFTLIEVLVTGLIFAVSIVGVATFLVVTYEHTNTAYATNNSRMISDLLHTALTNTIQPAKQVTVSSLNKLIVTSVEDVETTFEYKPDTKQVLRNGKAMVLPNMRNVDNEITSLTFVSGTPKNSNVEIDFSLNTKFQDKTIKSGFSSGFHCRNK